MKKEQDDIANTIIDDVINLSFENINIHYNLKYLSLGEIEVEKKKIKEIIIPNVSGAKGVITTYEGSSIGSVKAGEFVTGTISTTVLATSVGAIPALGLPVTGLLFLIGRISYIINKLKKTSKYKEALTSYKDHINNKFEDIVKAFLKDF